MSYLFAVIATGLGFVEVLGWLFGLQMVKSFFIDFAPMKANTALCALLLGLSLWIDPGPSSSSRRYLSRFLAAISILISMATLFEYLSQTSLGIDQLIGEMVNSGTNAGAPIRMTFVTAFIQLLIGSAILIRHRFARAVYFRQTLLVVNLFLATAVILAYLYRAEALAAFFPFTRIAIPTIISHILLSSSLLLSEGNVGFLADFLKPYAGARTARRLLPITFLTFAFLGLLTRMGGEHALYDRSSDAVIMVMIGSALQAWLVWKTVRKQNELEAKIEADRLRTERSLEAKVAERTRELELHIAERTRNEERQGFLSRLAKSLTEALTYEERIHKFASAVVPQLSDSCTVRIFEDGELRVKTGPLELRDSIPDNVTSDALDEAQALSVAETGRSLLLNDRQLLLPLVAMGRTIGTALFQNSLHGRVFQADDIPFLESVASLGAVAIENARLYRQARVAQIVIENVPAMIAYWDRDQRCRFANHTYREYFGVSAAQLAVMSMKQVKGPEVYQKDIARIEAAFNGQAQFFERELTSRMDGERRRLQVAYVPEVIDGQVLGIFVLMTDITALKEAQVSALAEKERAEAAVRMREEVLGIVSHDLSNPLASIEMTMQILAHASDPEIAPHILRVQHATEMMRNLISNLLDFGKLEAGVFTVEKVPGDVDDVVSEAMEALGAKAVRKEIEIHLALASSCPPILADKSRVIQVLWNLVGNAIKFTPKGGRITVRTAARVGEVEFSVIDTGPGIPAEDLPRIFDRFWQSKKTAALGTGLGLAIAKGIVLAHGGRIWAESRPGHGAHFHFTIPTAPSRAIQPETNAAPLPKLDDVRVLVVDDTAEILDLMELMLKKLGARPITAPSMDQALKEIERAHPEVVITDIEMANGDGYEFLKRIRAWSNEHGTSLPVAAFTGHASETSIKQIRDAGFNAFLTKPVSLQSLSAQVRRLLAAKAESVH